MNIARSAKAPYLSLRYARIGRVGEYGQLPSGWKGEHLADIEIVDINSPGEPWLTLDLAFRETMPGDHAGLCVGAYLPAPRGSVVALAGEVTLEDHTNIEAAFLIIREWEPEGALITQSVQPLTVDDGPRFAIVSHELVGRERVTQPLVMVKRKAVAPGRLSLTLRGLAFGEVAAHPDWLRTRTNGA